MYQAGGVASYDDGVSLLLEMEALVAVACCLSIASEAALAASLPQTPPMKHPAGQCLNAGQLCGETVIQNATMNSN